MFLESQGPWLLISAAARSSLGSERVMLDVLRSILKSSQYFFRDVAMFYTSHFLFRRSGSHGYPGGPQSTGLKQAEEG
jgi:hypothetical protein